MSNVREIAINRCVRTFYKMAKFFMKSNLNLYVCTSVLILLRFRDIFCFLKFIYSEKATKFCEIFTLLLTTVHTVKSKVKISQNFVAFSEYMNFT